MGYSIYGTDLSEKMIDYSDKNLGWLAEHATEAQQHSISKLRLEVGDATKHQWQPPVDFVASETYLGHPLSTVPSEVKFRELQSEAKNLLTAFLKNIGKQLKPDTQLALATPAWKRTDGSYLGVNILDEISKLRYNSVKYKYAQSDSLLYYREGQIVARQIIVLRKK